MKSRQEAKALLYDWVKSESLRKHCLSVAAAMERYAKKYVEEGRIEELAGVQPTNPSEVSNISSSELTGDDSKQVEGTCYEGGVDMVGNNISKQAIIDKYWITGLLHDFDYEKYPDINVHPKLGCEELKKLEYDSEIINAILGHNARTGVKRESLMAKTLFAVDELSGLIMALAHVRPGNFSGMTAKSVKKAMKKKDFAAAINREDIIQGMEELGIKEDDRDSHFETIVSSLGESKEELGF